MTESSDIRVDFVDEISCLVVKVITWQSIAGDDVVCKMGTVFGWCVST